MHHHTSRISWKWNIRREHSDLSQQHISTIPPSSRPITVLLRCILTFPLIVPWISVYRNILRFPLIVPWISVYRNILRFPLIVPWISVYRNILRFPLIVPWISVYRNILRFIVEYWDHTAISICASFRCILYLTETFHMDVKEYEELTEFFTEGIHPEGTQFSSQKLWNYKRRTRHYVLSDSVILYKVRVYNS